MDRVARVPWWLYIVTVVVLAGVVKYFHLWDGLIQNPFWSVIVTTVVLTQITIAGVTIYLHRNQAHSSLVLHPIVSHFFRFWMWLTTGMKTKEWAAIHRKHHAKVETKDDPHSPKTYGILRIVFAGVFLYVRESHNKETLKRYGHGTPDDELERKVYTPYHKYGIVLMLLFDFFVFGFLFGPIIGLAIWLVQIAWIPFWAAGFINGVGHYFGYRNYPSLNRKTGELDWSRNIVAWAFWIGGEELHNNHHAYPTSAKLSAKWYEFDIGWMYIRILETVGLAKVKFAYGRTKGPFDI